jgi:hypothetical protein
MHIQCIGIYNSSQAVPNNGHRIKDLQIDKYAGTALKMGRGGGDSSLQD